MRFAGFLQMSMSRSILEMLTFHEPCSPIHILVSCPDAAPCPVEVDCKFHETLAFQE